MSQAYDILEMLAATVQSGASDLHLTAGRPPLVRIRGEIQALPGYEALPLEELARQIFSLLYDEQKAKLSKNMELDFSYEVQGLARFRLNAFYHRQGLGAAARVVPGVIPTPDELMLPEAVKRLGGLPHGLILVTGPTGAGKSTTMAALVNEINLNQNKHIITIEDPMEFVFPQGKGLVTQREVGSATHTFANALRAALRQDPDVILVGELRDLETIQLAMTAAETGHLVFATLHTSDAPSTIDRVIDVFAPHQQQQIRVQLGSSLKAVVCQRLLPRADGRGRVAAREIMFVNPAIATMIRSAKSHEIPNALMTNSQLGMVRGDQDLVRLLEFGLIDLDTARTHIIDGTLLANVGQAPKKKGMFG